MPEVPSALEVPWVSLASGPGGSRESRIPKENQR